MQHCPETASSSMSTFNRLLSRRDKHHNHDEEQKNEVDHFPSLPKRGGSLPLCLLIMDDRSSTSSFSEWQATRSIRPPDSLSMAFTRLRPKRSPYLQASDLAIECISANSRKFLLQPKDQTLSTRLNGIFVDEETDRKSSKDDEAKVCSLQICQPCG